MKCSGFVALLPEHFSSGRSGVGSGQINTAAFMAGQQAKATTADDIRLNAPFLAASYLDNSFGGWYLPALVELNILAGQIATVNATLTTEGTPINTATVYWSSTYASSDTQLWARSMDVAGVQYPQSDALAVRAIRQF